MDVTTFLAKKSADTGSTEKQAIGKLLGLGGRALLGGGKLYGKAMRANPLATTMATGGAGLAAHNTAQSQLEGLKKQHGNLYEARKAMTPWAWGSGGGLKSNIGQAASTIASNPFGAAYSLFAGPAKQQDFISPKTTGVTLGKRTIDPVTGEWSRPMEGRQQGRLSTEAHQDLQTYNKLRERLRPIMGDEWYNQGQSEGGASNKSTEAGGGLTDEQQELLNRIDYYFGPDTNFRLHGLSRMADPRNASY